MKFNILNLISKHELICFLVMWTHTHVHVTMYNWTKTDLIGKDIDDHKVTLLFSYYRSILGCSAAIDCFRCHAVHVFKINQSRIKNKNNDYIHSDPISCEGPANYPVWYQCKVTMRTIRWGEGRVGGVPTGPHSDISYRLSPSGSSWRQLQTTDKPFSCFHWCLRSQDIWIDSLIRWGVGQPSPLVYVWKEFIAKIKKKKNMDVSLQGK